MMTVTTMMMTVAVVLKYTNYSGLDLSTSFDPRFENMPI